jgi:integrase
MLTQKELNVLVSNAATTGKPMKKSDGQGMSFFAKPNGSASWLLDFRLAGTPKTISLGQYPDVSLKEARTLREGARRLIAQGINPADQRRSERVLAAQKANADKIAASNTFQAVAEQWLTRQGGKEKTIQARNARVAKLYKSIGHRPISEIETPELLKAISKIEDEDKLHTVKRVRALASDIWNFAIIHGKARFNVAEPLKKAFKTKPPEHLAAVIKPKEVGQLMLAIDNLSSDITKAGLILLALTFARPGEVRKMTWDQIDLDNAVWNVPAANTKMKKEHTVPLSTQAIKILKALKTASDGSGYVLASTQSASGMISDMTFNKALRSLGYDGDRHVSHGFRSTGSTLMREQKGWDNITVELALSHKIKGVEGIYQRITLLEPRRKLLQEYADYLDQLKAEAKA